MDGTRCLLFKDGKFMAQECQTKYQINSVLLHVKALEKLLVIKGK